MRAHGEDILWHRCRKWSRHLLTDACAMASLFGWLTADMFHSTPTCLFHFWSSNLIMGLGETGMRPHVIWWRRPRKCHSNNTFQLGERVCVWAEAAGDGRMLKKLSRNLSASGLTTSVIHLSHLSGKRRGNQTKQSLDLQLFLWL